MTDVSRPPARHLRASTMLVLLCATIPACFLGPAGQPPGDTDAEITGSTGVGSTGGGSTVPEGSTDAGDPSGVDTSTSGAADSTSAPDPGTAGEPETLCEDLAGACQVRAPVGWSGPLAVYAGAPEALPECLDPLVDPVFEAGSGLEAEPAVCSCQCEISEASCAGYQVQSHNSTTCDNPQAIATLEVDGCIPISGGSQSIFTGVTPHPAVGACTPNESTERPPPTWALRYRGCAGELPAADDCADDELCLPQGLHQTCIARSGDHECPAGDYVERTLVFEDFEDQRACTACLCGSLAATCNPEILTHGAPGCPAADVVGSLTGGGFQCNQVPAASASYTVAVAGGCEPSPVEPSGAVMGDDPLTLCCLRG